MTEVREEEVEAEAGDGGVGGEELGEELALVRNESKLKVTWVHTEREVGLH